MKIVTPTEANAILQEMITNNQSGEVKFAFRPDYKTDSEGLNNLLRTLGKGWLDIEGGSYLIEASDKPYIRVSIDRINWDGEIVDYPLPEMGSVISDTAFRWSCDVAFTVDASVGQEISIKNLFVTPTPEMPLEIAWGDGETIQETTTNGELTHTYASAGRYTIFVKGQLVNNPKPGKSNSTIKVIHFITPPTMYSTQYMFFGFHELTHIVGSVKLSHNTGNPKTQLSYIFYQCRNLENIKGFKLILPKQVNSPEKSPTTLQQTFGGVSDDPEVKANLIKDFRIINHDRNAITNLDTTFASSNIDILPIDLFGRNVTNGYQAFKNCPNIQYLPATVFEKLETADEMFYCNPDCATTLNVSISLKLPHLTKAPGMFGNRALSFDEIKAIFESLPKNPSPKRGYTGNSMIDKTTVDSNYCITFAFDINEPNVKNKLISYFNLNVQAMMKYHKDYDAVDNGNRTKKQWDGGWYPIYNTYYGHSWDCNNKKGWWVNFRNPYNYEDK